MSGFTKLVPHILQSSIWNESSDVRVVWITLLAAKDEEGFVRGDERTIARLANVSLDATREALRIFQEPDPASGTPDNEGRRIQAAPGGWVVLNHAIYRGRDQRAEHAEYVRKWRAGKLPVTKCDSQVNHCSVSVSESLSVSHGKGMQGETDIELEAGTSLDASDPIVGTFSLVGGKPYHVRESLAAVLRAAYPAVVVDRTIAEIAAWCECNPSKRKTESGARRFLNSWFAREQNR